MVWLGADEVVDHDVEGLDIYFPLSLDFPAHLSSTYKCCMAGWGRNNHMQLTNPIHHSSALCSLSNFPSSRYPALLSKTSACLPNTFCISTSRFSTSFSTVISALTVKTGRLLFKVAISWEDLSMRC